MGRRHNKVLNYEIGLKNILKKLKNVMRNFGNGDIVALDQINALKHINAILIKFPWNVNSVN